MKKLTSLFIWLVLICSAAHSQRTLSIVSPPMEADFDEVIQSNRVYFTERYSRKMQVYNGTSLSDIDYPYIGTQIE
jgi:hypothetical protein